MDDLPEVFDMHEDGTASFLPQTRKRRIPSNSF
jgi:hypothetical protein